MQIGTKLTAYDLFETLLRGAGDESGVFKGLPHSHVSYAFASWLTCTRTASGASRPRSIHTLNSCGRRGQLAGNRRQTIHSARSAGETSRAQHAI